MKNTILILARACAGGLVSWATISAPLHANQLAPQMEVRRSASGQEISATRPEGSLRKDPPGSADDESPVGDRTLSDDPMESDVFLDGDIHISPDPVLAGQKIIVRYSIKNGGKAATSAGFQTRVVVKNPTEFQFILLDFPVPPLSSGEVSEQEHHIPLASNLRSGAYSVRLRLDPFFDIANEGERFNDATDPFYFALVAVQPDLLVKFAEVCPHSAHPGDQAQLNFTVFNQSSSPAPAARNRIELFNPKTNQKVFSSYLTNGIIAPHGSAEYAFAFTVPATGLPGRWAVSVFLNDFLDYAEADTFNNVQDPLVYLTVVAAGVAVELCAQPIKLNHPRWTNGRLVFEVSGSGSDTLTLQSSSDLKTWNAAGQVTLANGTGTYTAPDGSIGFFRAIK